MNLNSFVVGSEVYANCECIHGRTFIAAPIGEKSAILPVNAADFCLSQDNCAHSRRYECLPLCAIPTV